MTAHPAWLQSQYDQNRAGSVIVGRSKRPAEALRVVDTKNGGPVGAVRRTRKGPRYAF